MCGRNQIKRDCLYVLFAKFDIYRLYAETRNSAKDFGDRKPAGIHTAIVILSRAELSVVKCKIKQDTSLLA